MDKPPAFTPSPVAEPAAVVVENPWQKLRQFTAARIALGRTGVSLPTQPQLAFQLAHARARDAVHLPLDVGQLAQDLERLGVVASAQDCLHLESAAGNRLNYLQRPDLGRRLGAASKNRLDELAAQDKTPAQPVHDVAFVIADGLSALAVAQNAAPFLAVMMRQMAAHGWSVAPLSIVSLGRVAVADEVGELLGAKSVVLLIGERPGLSSPDSMGLYLTWMPKVGLNDANRNCISNVRPAGLSYEEAAFKLDYLMTEMHKRGLSGVLLKDETGSGTAIAGAVSSNFCWLPVSEGLVFTAGSGK